MKRVYTKCTRKGEERRREYKKRDRSKKRRETGNRGRVNE